MGGTPIGRRRWDRCSGKIHDAAERVRSEPKKRMESRFGATGCIRLGEGAEARKAVLASLGLSCCEEVLHLFEYETAGCPPWPLPSDEENGQGRWLTGLRLEMDRHPEWRALDVRLAKSWGHGGANPEVAAVRLKRQSEPFVAEYHGWGHETMEPAGWLLWTMQPGMLWPLWGQPVPVP
ncbi:MAG: hypothetical protein FJ125_16420 [Deltaproteobacteria bacterium]|nr:hypothetical protein [Deltaproteobacteria bacterium]